MVLVTSGTRSSSRICAWPLLFLIYINELEQGIKSSINFFPDDTVLYSIVHDKFLSNRELNHAGELNHARELNNDHIKDLADQWEMAFNPDQTSCRTHFFAKENQCFFNGVVLTLY